MSTHFSLVCFIILNTILHLTRPTASQCLVVYVSIDSIDGTLTATDWEGTYSYAGINTTDGCLAYSSSSGQTLRYYSGSWALSSSTADLLSYEFTPSGPCDPPLGVALPWTHGSVATDTTITTTCSTSSYPTTEPTLEPTPRPTENPVTSAPTAPPSLQPSASPSKTPSANPSSTPSTNPSSNPSATPSAAPSKSPTLQPSMPPTLSPTQPPVLPPTHGSTDGCSRIYLYVIGPSDEVGSTVDGVYYLQSNAYPLSLTWDDSLYPFWKQQYSGTDPDNPGPSYSSVIYWQSGYWHIIDNTGIRIQYQGIGLNVPSATAYTPPHTQLGNGWYDLNDGRTWFVEIKCSELTDVPTSYPTIEPTRVPTTDPTVEPTVQPTQAKPTFYPTLEPIVASTTDAGDDGDEQPAETFLDRFSVFEWLVIASLPLIVLLICGSLYVWRANRIEAAQKEYAWHQPSAVGNQKDEVEMAVSKKKNQRPKKLTFEVGSPSQKRISGLGALGGGPTPVKSYKDVNVEADFSNALKVASSQKSRRSMEEKGLQVKRESYHEIDTVSPMIEDEPNTNDVHHMMTYDEAEVERQDSDFYGDHPIDEIYSYTFVTKPFGMEWKTLKKDKKNLYVSKVTKKSQAELGKIGIGSKLISFNGEMIEGLGAKKIYAKLAITEMPLTITFLKPPKREQDKEGDAYKKTEADPEAVVDDAAAPSGLPQVAPVVPAQIGGTPTPEAPEAEAALLGGDQPMIPPKVPSIDSDYAAGGGAVNPTDEDDPFAEIGDNPVNGFVVSTNDEEEEEEEPPQIKSQPTEAMMQQAQALIPEVFDDEESEEEEERRQSVHA
eukprot:242159_1